MEYNLSKEQGEYFNQIEEVTLSISNGYRNIYTSKSENEKEEHTLKLQELITYENELYDSISQDSITKMLDYFNKTFAIYSKNKKTDAFLTEKINQDYQTYYNLLHQSSDNFWFRGMQTALLERIKERLTGFRVKDSNSSIISNLPSSLMYANLLTSFDNIIEDGTSNTLKKREYYEFIKYNLIIRNGTIENCFWNKDSDTLKENFLVSLEDTKSKETINKITTAEIKLILDHLFSLTDDKMENLSNNTKYIAEIDCMMLRGYNLLLQEDSILQMKEYSDREFKRDANQSNHIRSKKLIKKAFEQYQEDRKIFLNIDEEK